MKIIYSMSASRHALVDRAKKNVRWRIEGKGKGKVEKKASGRSARAHTRNEAHLTTELLSSGCCHLVSRHQLTGQLLLSSASTQTPGLIKPQPRHSPINHLMMSYRGDHWAASIDTQEHISAHPKMWAGEFYCVCVGKDTHTHHGYTPPLVCQNTCCAPLLCLYLAACLGGVRNMKTLMKVPFDSIALILGAARICVWAKHLFSPLISNISLFYWNQRGLWTVANGGLAHSLLMLWVVISL